MSLSVSPDILSCVQVKNKILGINSKLRTSDSVIYLSESWERSHICSIFNDSSNKKEEMIGSLLDDRIGIQNYLDELKMVQSMKMWLQSGRMI